MKMTVITVLAIGLFATNVAGVSANPRKTDRGGEEARSNGAHMMTNSKTVSGKSFGGRSSLGAGTAPGRSKIRRAPSPAGNDDAFDGVKFFEDGLLNGG